MKERKESKLEMDKQKKILNQTLESNSANRGGKKRTKAKNQNIVDWKTKRSGNLQRKNKHKERYGYKRTKETKGGRQDTHGAQEKEDTPKRCGKLHNI